MTISGLCKLTMRADNRATVQSTVATKTCSSLISCSTIHELLVLHAWECDAITGNVVKRFANQNRANCLFDVIGHIRYVELLRNTHPHPHTHNARRVQRTAKNEEGKTSFSLGRSAESFVFFCQTSRHNLRGL